MLADLPWGRIGLTICYDLRFPALYRALAEAGATVLTIPSAFTRQTGEAHWHVLLRARAIENGSFVLAARAGRHARERPRDLRAFAGRRPVGPHSWQKAAPSPAWSWPRSIRPKSRPRAPRVPSLQHGRRFDIVEPIAEPAHLHVVGDTP